MSLLKSRSTLHQRKDSVVVADSDDDEETQSPVKGKNLTDMKVIKDSDSESTGVSSASDVEDAESEDDEQSEDEDLRFINNTQRISIVENSSDSESESSESSINYATARAKSSKRRSIYENPSHTSETESPPINSGFTKKSQRAIAISDSEDESVSDEHNQSANKSKSQCNDHKTTSKRSVNGSSEEHLETSLDSFSEKDVSKDKVPTKAEGITVDSLSEEENVAEDNIPAKPEAEKVTVDSLSEEEDIVEDIVRGETPKRSKLPLRSINNSNNKFGSARASVAGNIISANTNVIDLTINDPPIARSTKNLNQYSKPLKSNHRLVSSNCEILQKKQDRDVIISSSSTSENEVDKDLLLIARKESGVGNADLIKAQKKELLLIDMDKRKKELDKLSKVVTVMDIEKLPDKGKKIFKDIKEKKQAIAKLEAELEKLSQSYEISNIPGNTKSPKRSNFSSKKHLDFKTSSESSDEDNSESLGEDNSESSDEDNSESSDEDDSKSSNEDEDSEDYSVSEESTEDENIVKKKQGKNKVNKKSDKYSNHFNEFDVNNIPKVPKTAFDISGLAGKALETFNKQQSLTHKSLKELHGSLISRPAENKRDPDPPGLQINLMPHQQHALAWMKWRETQKPKGGILADDMGLGKTLTMISLVLATIDNVRGNSSEDNDSDSDDAWYSRKKNKKNKRYYGGTLVVCPASLIKQWESEVNNRCKRDLLSVLVFHGNKREIDDRKLSKFNIVITTYQTLVKEAEKETSMYKMEWNRVILDEAHYIRNHKSKACLAACGVDARYRWALTGTPIQNKEEDVFAILKYLQCSPFNDLQVWKRWVDNKDDAGKQRLITLMKTLMLRRTKQELQAKGTLDSLPSKSLDVIEIVMDREETLAYQKILLFSQNLFAQFLSQRAEKAHMREMYGGKYNMPSYASSGSKTHFTKAQKLMLKQHSSVEAHEILVLLLRLRQMCCHPALIHSMLDKNDAEVNGLDESAHSTILNKLNNMSFKDDDNVEDHVASYKIDKRVAANLLTKKNPVFDNNRRGSKVRKVIETIEEIIDKGDKIVVVSQWTSFLEVIARNLKKVDDANYAMFTGAVAVKNRQAIVEKLNDPRNKINILLLSLTAGGVGLNLVGANHLLLVDIHWNPQLESQAQDRIYRFGQKKDVYIYKFICKDTIEERVKKLQDKKLEIANHVLTGSRTVSSKLTIDDLKSLFS